MLTLENSFLLNNPSVVVVGCGGTGAFVAEGLLRLFTGRGARFLLVDHDRVERHNLLRQQFYREDLGRFKSQALAERLANQYNREVSYSVYPYTGRLLESRVMGSGFYEPANLLIGCVDNAAARRAINDPGFSITSTWVVDAGNDTSFGQVLVGNSDDVAFLSEDRWLRLPSPLRQRPDLLTAAPTAPVDVDCAAALDLVDQDPTINHMMASLVLQMVRRLVAGTCPWMGLYLDLEQGTVVPNYATEEAVARICPVERYRR